MRRETTKARSVRWPLVGTALASPGVTAGARAQKLTPADAATRLSGTWVLNTRADVRVQRARATRRRAWRGPAAMAMAPAIRPARRRTDRRRRRTRVTWRRRSARRWRRCASCSSWPKSITIKATAEQVTFEDARGQRTYALDGKSVKMTVGRRRGQHQVAVGQGRPQAGVLDRPEQADADLGRRRERPAGARSRKSRA